MSGSVGVVVIGRNEGERLAACLRSLQGESTGPVVYVDSGSTDDSVAAAESFGAAIVRLDMTSPFTAARARNAGARRLCELGSPDYVQFLDGDCTLVRGWIGRARAHLDANPEIAVVAGRRRERAPETSVYNRLCDIEWATPVGETAACGGDAMMRMSALSAAGFYDPRLVAGEEPELCLRLREKGWRIWRLDADMTMHDAAIKSFRQWWKRASRSGHAYAEVSSLHRRSPHRIWRRETWRAILWAAALPITLVLAIAISSWFFVALLAYPLQALRLWASARGRYGRDAAPWALLTVIGKFAEASGVLRFHANRMLGRRSALIEYK